MKELMAILGLAWSASYAAAFLAQVALNELKALGQRAAVMHW